MTQDKEKIIESLNVEILLMQSLLVGVARAKTNKRILELVQVIKYYLTTHTKSLSIQEKSSIIIKNKLFIIADREAGMSLRKIGKKYNLSHEAIRGVTKNKGFLCPPIIH